MSEAHTRLTVHFGERGRNGGEPLADRLMSVFEEGEVGRAVLLRGAEGFGPKHGLQSAGLLTLSEDLPMVAVAFDSSEKVEPVAGQVRSLLNEGLVTVEPVRRSVSPLLSHSEPEDSPFSVTSGGCRLTVWTGRHCRVGGAPAHARVVQAFRQSGAGAAIALLGVDGVIDGVRQRAGFFSANREVPVLVVGVGGGEAIKTAEGEISRLLPGAPSELLELESQAASLAGDAESCGLFRLAVYGSGADSSTGIRQQQAIIRMLRREGAAGATALFGYHGFLGKEIPHGDSFRSLRRRIPVLTEVIDTSANCRRWLYEIERLTAGSARASLSQVQSLGPVKSAGTADPLSRPGGRA